MVDIKTGSPIIIDEDKMDEKGTKNIKDEALLGPSLIVV